MNMNKKIAIMVAGAMLLSLPVLSFAQFDSGPVPISIPTLTVDGIMNKIFGLIWPLFVGIAVIMFLVAGFEYFTARGEANKIATANQFVVFGIVGVAVAVLAFSIPFIVKNTLGF